MTFLETLSGAKMARVKTKFAIDREEKGRGIVVNKAVQKRISESRRKERGSDDKVALQEINDQATVML